MWFLPLWSNDELQGEDLMDGFKQKRGYLRGFSNFRTDPGTHDPHKRQDVPDAPRCKTCGAVLRKGNVSGYCSPHYMGEVEIPDVIVEIAENADYIEQIADLLRDDIMTPEAKQIYLELHKDGGQQEV